MDASLRCIIMIRLPLKQQFCTLNSSLYYYESPKITEAFLKYISELTNNLSLLSFKTIYYQNCLTFPQHVWLNKSHASI